MDHDETDLHHYLDQETTSTNTASTAGELGEGSISRQREIEQQH